jgi:hypothetical protein
MMHSIDQLAAGQEEITREIAKLQEIEQNILSKGSDHPLHLASAPMSKPVLRPSLAPSALTHAKVFNPKSVSWRIVGIRF